jgi:DNA-directed RNA polymerase subunit K/omega
MDIKVTQVVKKEERLMTNILTKMEWTEASGIRISALSNGSKSTLTEAELKDTEFNPAAIARKELEMRKFPLIIRRIRLDDKVEEWDINELIPNFNIDELI